MRVISPYKLRPHTGAAFRELDFAYGGKGGFDVEVSRAAMMVLATPHDVGRRQLLTSKRVDRGLLEG
jgi:hypothetical protein